MQLAAAAVIFLAGIAYGSKSTMSPGEPSPQRLQLLAQPEALEAPSLHIKVAVAIIAEPSSQTPLQLSIEPMSGAPPMTSLMLSGVPPEVSVSAGRAVGMGEWQIPLSELHNLAFKVPAGLSGESEIALSLLGGWDGASAQLAHAKTRLIINASGASQKPVAVVSSVLRDDPIGPEASLRPAAAATQTELIPLAPSQHENANRIVEEAQSTPRGPKATDKSRPRLANLTPQEQDLAEKLVARGQSALGYGNVAAARQFFLRAAEANFARGALLLAATYDPQELDRLGVLGVQPNPHLARIWYDRARLLGEPEADERLARLRQAKINEPPR
jgi:hypothetical protein